MAAAPTYAVPFRRGAQETRPEATRSYGHHALNIPLRTIDGLRHSALRPAALVDRVLAKLRGLVERFDDPATPYLAMPVAARRPRFSDYEHLERVARNEAEEWQA